MSSSAASVGANPGGAEKQLQAEASLKRLDVPRDRRLRQAQRPRGTKQGSLPQDGEEAALKAPVGLTRIHIFPHIIAPEFGNSFSGGDAIFGVIRS